MDESPTYTLGEGVKGARRGLSSEFLGCISNKELDYKMVPCV